MELTLWQEILYGWILLTVVPKLLVIPVWRWMYGAMKATDEQDAIDAAWLASLESGGAGSGGSGDRTRRPRRPRRDRDPSRRPGGSTALRPTRTPPRTDARARRMPRIAVAR